MRNAPLPLIGQFYSDDARPWSQQDVCNYLPVSAETEGTRTPTKCATPPGLAPRVQLPASGAIPAGPIRGLHNADGRLFAVSTAQLWQISPQGVAIPRGAIGGTSRVRMAHNQQTAGSQLIIVNGTSGYLYDTQAQTLTAISDPGYPGAIDVVFLDGYFIQIDPTRRFAFNSDVADGASYNTLDRFTSEVAPDRLVGLAAPNNELLLLSERSAEFFENTGAAQQPFRSKRISLERGAASRTGQAQLDNSVFWLGNDGKFYALEGYVPKRISTRPIEQAIRGLNWAQAFAFVWESEGHAVVYWTFPDGRTWGYDASQGRWHRRASYGLDRWRVNCTAFYGDEWVAGDFQAGKLWTVEWGYPWEGQTEFISEVVAPVIHDHQNRVLMPRLEVLMDTGMPEIEPRDFPAQPEGPAIAGDAPGSYIGAVYSFAYTTTQGDAAIVSVAVHTGTVPAGLTLSNAGVLSGTPTASGLSTFTVRVTDSNGLYADVDDTVTITVPWLMIGSFSGPPAGGFRRSPDGVDWSAAAVEAPAVQPFRPSSGGTLTRHEGELLAAAAATPVGSFRRLAWSGDRGDTWTSLDFSSDPSGGQSGYLDGVWYVAGGTSGITTVEAGAVTATFPAVGANALASDGAQIWTDGAAGRLVQRNAALTVIEELLPPAFVTLANGTIVAGGGDVVYAGVVSGTFAPWAHKYAGPGEVLDVVTLPFTTPPDASFGPVLHYSEGRGLWIIALRNEVAYGPLDALVLSPTTLAFNCLGIGDDGALTVFVGNNGAATATDLDTITAVAGFAGNAQDAVPLYDSEVE